MRRNNLKVFVLTALLAALTCAATMIIHIPSPIGGYMNMGDCIVVLSGIVLGPILGAVAGGLGSALADFLYGYMAYVPGTFVIKALMAFCSSLIYFKGAKKLSFAALGAFIAELIMIIGYFAYEAVVLRLGFGAVGGLISNLMQGIAGLVFAIVIISAFKKNKSLSKYVNSFKN